MPVRHISGLYKAKHAKKKSTAEVGGNKWHSILHIPLHPHVRYNYFTTIHIRWLVQSFFFVVVMFPSRPMGKEKKSTVQSAGYVIIPQRDYFFKYGHCSLPPFFLCFAQKQQPSSPSCRAGLPFVRRSRTKFFFLPCGNHLIFFFGIIVQFQKTLKIQVRPLLFPFYQFKTEKFSFLQYFFRNRINDTDFQARSGLFNC